LDETLRAAFRALHLLGAVLWLGGMVMGFVLLQQGATNGGLPPTYWLRFRTIARAAIWALLISGAALIFDRLALPRALTPPYLAALIAHVGLSLAMFAISFSLPRQLIGQELVPVPPERKGRWLIALGVIVTVLGAAMTVLYERALRAL
jgi:putative copper export protein